MKINIYKKRNGEKMIYINDYKKKVSVGVSDDPIKWSKLTKGQRNVLDAALNAFLDVAKPFKGDVSVHGEEVIPLNDYGDVLLTDIATIGGQKVSSDGAYLVRKFEGKLLYANIADIK